MPALAIHISYLLVIILLGIYGVFYVAFSPNEATSMWAKYISLVFFVYFTGASVIFFLKNAEKAGSAFKRKWKFYAFIAIGLPGIFAVLAFFHFGALAKGMPAIYTALTAEKQIVEAKIENKRLWGRRNRWEEVSITGFSGGFPVSKRYYDSVLVGETVTLEIMKSKLGSKIEFIKS